MITVNNEYLSSINVSNNIL